MKVFFDKENIRDKFKMWFGLKSKCNFFANDIKTFTALEFFCFVCLITTIEAFCILFSLLIAVGIILNSIEFERGVIKGY